MKYIIEIKGKKYYHERLIENDLRFSITRIAKHIRYVIIYHWTGC